jgi:hypothetical protein
MNLFYKLTFLDDKYKIIRETVPIQSKSFLKGFVWCLNSAFTSAKATSAIQDTQGNIDTPISGYQWSFHPGGDSQYLFSSSSYLKTDEVGIVVGTGNTPITVDDYKLASQIYHGSTSGKFEYLSCAITNLVVSGAAYSFDLQRIFLNSSGGSIDIAEIGIYSRIYLSPSGNSNFMIIRDIVSAAETVTDGVYIKATYTFQIT